MADLARVIRSFPTIDVTPPQRVIATGDNEAPNVVMVFGKSGSPKTLAASYNYSMTAYMEKSQKEVQTSTKSNFTGTWGETTGQPFGASD